MAGVTVHMVLSTRMRTAIILPHTPTLPLLPSLSLKPSLKVYLGECVGSILYMTKNRVLGNYGNFLENDFWTPPPLLSILYMTIFIFQKISIHI